MSHDDFAVEPIRGIPCALPDGEQLLWQGVPKWRSLATRAYHVRKVALYFVILILWRAALGMDDGTKGSAVLLSCAFLALLGIIAIGVLCLLAYLAARSSVYSITNRRVLIRHGIAVPMTMNIPFNCIESAALKQYTDGTGEIAFATPRDERIGYLITWPHLRPGEFTRPQPSLRALVDAGHAADLLRTVLVSGSMESMPQFTAPPPAVASITSPGAPGIPAASAAPGTPAAPRTAAAA
jgi:hypothetical protein